ncbi:hypothetical protein A4A49_58774, partial [Nicotiana attenuata]
EYLYLAKPSNTAPSKIPLYVKWHPPNMGSYKFNTDGAARSSNSFSGYDGVIRDSTGNWELGFSGCSYHANSLHMELLGVLQGLRLALQHNLMPLEIEIDATEVIHLLNTDNLLYSHMLNDCRSMIHQLGNPPIKHAYREQKLVADRLARYAIEARLCTTAVIFEEPPLFVLDLLHAD